MIVSNVVEGATVLHATIVRGCYRGWIDIWDVLSSECREEVVLIECDALMDTLENYLRKHRYDLTLLLQTKMQRGNTWPPSFLSSPSIGAKYLTQLMLFARNNIKCK